MSMATRERASWHAHQGTLREGPLWEPPAQYFVDAAERLGVELIRFLDYETGGENEPVICSACPVMVLYMDLTGIPDEDQLNGLVAADAASECYDLALADIDYLLGVISGVDETYSIFEVQSADSPYRRGILTGRELVRLEGWKEGVIDNDGMAGASTQAP